MESGLEQLKRSAEKGHVEASYVYGIILLCMGGKSSIQGLRILNGMIKGSPKLSKSRIQECRESAKAIIRTMWINNSMVRQQTNLTNFCCHEKMRLRETWNGREYEDDESSCDACKWMREVKLFCNMLSGGSFD